MTAEYELAPEPEAPPHEDEIELLDLPEHLLPPGAETVPLQKKGPLREFEARRIPDSAGELLVRALPLSLKTWVAPVVYAPLTAAALSFQQIPGTLEPYPLPGQIVASFVLSFCILERSQAAYEEAETFDVMALPFTLLRALFLTPLFVGLGQMPWSAYAVLPLAVVFLPLVLGALATNSWGELTPKGLWNALWETPSFAANAVWCSVFVALGMGAAWALPEGDGIWRGLVAVMGFAVAGAVAGAARLDAEIGE